MGGQEDRTQKAGSKKVHVDTEASWKGKKEGGKEGRHRKAGTHRQAGRTQKADRQIQRYDGRKVHL